MADPKVTLHVDTKVKKAELVALHREIEKRGGPAAVKMARAVNKAKREIKLLGGEAEKTNKIFTRFTNGIAIGNLMAMAAAKATGLLTGSIKELGKATLVAAHIEELGAVYQFVGKNAGYSGRQLEAYNQALQISGIRQDSANQSLLRALQANIDLGDAVKFARIGQDAATVGLMESSEAYQRIIDSIAKLYPRLLKEIGIIINLNVEYARYAKAHKTRVTDMTEAEKKQAMMNAIIEKGARLTGAYETAMTMASKRLRSIPRWFQDAQQAVGRYFLPAFDDAISVTERFLKGVTKAFSDPLEAIRKAGAKFDKVSSASLKLADRYDELAKKAELTIDEQVEINDLLSQFEKLSPDIVTAWDNQGNAISINTTKLRDNIKAQKESLDLDLQQVLKDRGAEFKRMSARVTELAATITDLNIPIPTVHQGFKVIERGQAGMALELVRLKKALGEFVEETRLGLPVLTKGTETYAFALRVMGQEFIDLINAAEAADAGLKTLSDNMGDLPSSPLEGLFPNVIELEPFMDEIERAKKEAEESEKERVRLHKEALLELESVHFDASLVGMNEHLAARAEAERTHFEWLATLREDTKLSEEEYAQAKRDSEIILQADLSRIQLEAVDETAQMYADRWSLAIEATEEIFGNLARIAVTDTKLIGKEMREVFKNVGRSLVVNLVKKGIKALALYVFGLIAAKAATKLFGGEQKNAVGVTILQTSAAVALAGATGGVAIASGVATAALIIESKAVKAQTAHYIALAAAKAAASLGTTTGVSIAAATTVKAALVTMLMTGFDDPANDRIAYRHGKDYAQLFMAGIQSEWRAPDFGRDIRQALPTSAVQPVGGDGDFSYSSGPPIIVNVAGSIITEGELIDQIINALAEREGADGNLNLSGSLTGGRA